MSIIETREFKLASLNFDAVAPPDRPRVAPGHGSCERRQQNANTRAYTAAADSQDLPDYRISLDKLTEKLRSKFGAGAYEIFLMHDVYTVKAPGRLSATEIAECR
ncbi:hypothetical protein B0T14DRAFT_241251 [Immersiella caudata]|uniref:Uncharacterized protein n=1 Tax=Immersiella caudata TaxID=314043 RepID=A0AA40C0N4_9PEZI|nr:hypothetical protein B0T14DRAFT_241251 [Immersiella caudata]